MPASFLRPHLPMTSSAFVNAGLRRRIPRRRAARNGRQQPRTRKSCAALFSAIAPCRRTTPGSLCWTPLSQRQVRRRHPGRNRPGPHTLFIVSSKSGGTIETLSFYRHFRDLTEETPSPLGGGLGWGSTRAPTSSPSPTPALRWSVLAARHGLPPGVPEPRRHWRALLRAVVVRNAPRRSGWHRRKARLLDAAAASMRDRCLDDDDAQANPGLQIGRFAWL